MVPCLIWYYVSHACDSSLLLASKKTALNRKPPATRGAALLIGLATPTTLVSFLQTEVCHMLHWVYASRKPRGEWLATKPAKDWEEKLSPMSDVSYFAASICAQPQVKMTRFRCQRRRKWFYFPVFSFQGKAHEIILETVKGFYSILSAYRIPVGVNNLKVFGDTGFMLPALQRLSRRGLLRLCVFHVRAYTFFIRDNSLSLFVCAWSPGHSGMCMETTIKPAGVSRSCIGKTAY